MNKTKRTSRSYTISPAKYCKQPKMMAVWCREDGTGFKTELMRLADILSGGRYSKRESAYIMSPKRAKLFPLLVRNGWTAPSGYWTGPLGFLEPHDGSIMRQGTFTPLKGLRESDIV